MKFKPLCSLALLLIFCAPVQPQTKSKLAHLKSWANEYPIDATSEPRRDIFALPEVRAPLARLLGRQGFSNMVAAFDRVSPSDLVNGYLLLHGWTNTRAQPETYLVIINLESGEMRVAHQRGSSVKWYGGAAPSDLPSCLVSDFTASPSADVARAREQDNSQLRHVGVKVCPFHFEASADDAPAQTLRGDSCSQDIARQTGDARGFSQ